MKIFAFFCLLLFTGLAHAQETANWEVTVYIPNESAIVTLTAEGETGRIALPETADSLLKNVYRPKVKLSPDHRWLAFDQGEDRGTVQVADLQAGTCCEEFSKETELPNEITHGSFVLADFSPDSIQLALQSFEGCTPGAEICYPRAMGVLIELKTMTASISGSFAQYDEMPLDWNGTGMVSVQRSYCMEGDICTAPTVTGRKVTREVETGNAISYSPIAVHQRFGDIGDDLPLSGEYISSYIYNPYGEFKLPVVVYYSPSMNPTEWQEKPALIYIATDYDSRGLIEDHILFAHWITDGQAVLIRTMKNQDRPTLLFRDGRTLSIDIPDYNEFLSATSDGWLMYERQDIGGDPTPEQMGLLHYQYIDEKLVVSEIASYPNDQGRIQRPTLLEAYPLGKSVTQPFKTTELPKPMG